MNLNHLKSYCAAAVVVVDGDDFAVSVVAIADHLVLVEHSVVALHNGC